MKRIEELEAALDEERANLCKTQEKLESTEKAALDDVEKL